MPRLPQFFEPPGKVACHVRWCYETKPLDPSGRHGGDIQCIAHILQVLMVETTVEGGVGGISYCAAQSLRGSRQHQMKDGIISSRDGTPYVGLGGPRRSDE